MKIDVRERIGYFRRLLIWAGVVAALLFSCGEGIRLFPFPAGHYSDDAKIESTFALGLNSPEYVHCIEKKFEGSQSKSRRDDGPQNGIVQNSGAAAFLHPNVEVSAKAGHFGWPGQRDSANLVARMSGRAPPLS